MGGRPLTALNIVCFPDQEYPLTVLDTILQGGADKLQEAGCALMGGHSVQDQELKYGAAITGIVHPDRIATNAKSRPGDRLILTKPLGTGIVTTGVKFDRCNVRDEEEVASVMAELNQAAGQVMVQQGIQACTDITGFGLAGHGYEMAQASGVSMRLQASELPILAKAHELAAQGVETMGWYRNREYVGDRLHFSAELAEPWQRLAAEAETSGGLLMSVPADKAEATLSELHAVGVGAARIIGQVETEPAGHVWVE